MNNSFRSVLRVRRGVLATAAAMALVTAAPAMADSGPLVPPAGSATLENAQSSMGSLGSTLAGTGAVLETGRVSDSSIVLERNVLGASSGANVADNRLSGPGQLSLSSAQHSQASVTSGNLTEGGAALMRVGGTGSFGNAQAVSTATVRDNTVTAFGTNNQVANALVLAPGASTGPVQGLLSNDQAGWSEGQSTATVAGAGRGAPLVGLEYLGTVGSSAIAVTGNTVAAGSTGNTAANRLEANGTRIGGAAQDDVALANRQAESGAGRSATTRQVKIGVQEAASAAWSGVYESTIAVTGNRNLAEARNNDAVNSLAMTASSSLGKGAVLANSQESRSPASASAEGAIGIRARRTDLEGVTLVLTGNATQALATANTADNGVTAQASDLSGTGLTLGNVQSSIGGVLAGATSSSRIDLHGSSLYGTTAGVNDNSIAGIAQSNTARNVLAIDASAAGGMTGSVVSSQSASGQASARADGGFAVGTGHTYAGQLAVTGNLLRAAAGQNEASNQLTVTAASMPARSGFEVTNQQQGGGNVEAIALPSQVGVSLRSASSGALAVTGNEVSAAATVNKANNGLSLTTQGTSAATGTLINEQSTDLGVVNAAIGSERSATRIGVTSGSLAGGTALVSGNALNALAGGNNGANVLNASALNTQGPGAGLQMLNSQTNGAGLSASVQNVVLGVTAGGGRHEFAGPGLAGTGGSVLSNNIQAAGYGNTASNAITLNASAGASAGTASLVSRQVNTGAISAVVTGVSVGIGASGVQGSTAVISGNSVHAQAIGNSSVNIIGIK